MSFEARYPARCPLCEDRIGPGDQVTYADDELVHVASDLRGAGAMPGFGKGEGRRTERVGCCGGPRRCVGSAGASWPPAT